MFDLGNPTTTEVSMDYKEFRNLPNSTLCFPFYVDKWPYGGKKMGDKSTNWTEAKENLKQLANTDKYHEIFPCSTGVFQENPKAFEKGSIL